MSAWSVYLYMGFTYGRQKSKSIRTVVPAVVEVYLGVIGHIFGNVDRILVAATKAGTMQIVKGIHLGVIRVVQCPRSKDVDHNGVVLGLSLN